VSIFIQSYANRNIPDMSLIFIVVREKITVIGEVI